MANVIQGFFPGGRMRIAPPPPRVAQPFTRGTGFPVPADAGVPPRPPFHASTVQRLAQGTATLLPAHLANLPTLGGQALPPAVCQKMEAFFGTRLSEVRVHVGPHASMLGALAFTRGSDLYFAPGQYNPHLSSGQALLGHELAHVVQQKAGRVRNPFGSGTAVVQDAALENEADRLGQRAAAFQVPLPRPVASVQPRMHPCAAPPHQRPGPRRVRAGVAQGRYPFLHARIVQCANNDDVRPNSPRAQQINNAKGISWDSMNTTSTIEFDPPHNEYGSMAVFSLAYNADRSDMANQLGYDTITYRDKSDQHLHSEMLVIVDFLSGKIEKDDIVSWGVNRKVCKYCAIVLQSEGFSVQYDPSYTTKNWTNPYKHFGLSPSDSPPGVPWQ